ncbi:DUF4845 domain-containing protein [Massilia antarctica]|uniref:DUF4845 domain-containing protein n=1 Tax=Massilia antarctica TaxID=2765360 RepID=UPI0006BB59BD|nr:DUF4845 domain-containing protein [Massilia sp. H27-R4]MCY0914143.1 DUF4845 domain-containing protein [Massilia sp. H27-R4]CUI08541.1 PROBABLE TRANSMEMBRANE PROTEIN [Janthinobacterium sp. CG23_2]CUU32327.1 PROBABLE TRANSMEMBRANE PROTEIN [Janthinobacterium sp. CG23_2]
MYGSKPKPVNLATQQGVSLSGLIFLLGIITFIAMFAMKVFPTFLEYRAIKAGIGAAKKADGTVRDVQLSFDKHADINNIKVIKGTDLIITKETGETQVAFAYTARIPLITNVTLLIDYSGTTDPSGKIPEKPAEPIR